MGRIIKFALLTGLRPAEVVESVRLINASPELGMHYYNTEQRTLEHFRYPEIFIRNTKKAYISFVTPEIVKSVNNHLLHIPSHNAISRACNRRGLPCNMHLCRKVFASWLHKYGISAEIVDFLQGRVSTSVFSRHYLTPDSSLKYRVLAALH